MDLRHYWFKQLPCRSRIARVCNRLKVEMAGAVSFRSETEGSTVATGVDLVRAGRE